MGMHVHMCAHVWKGASQVCTSGAILTVYFEAGSLTADSAQLSGQQRPAATSAALKAQGHAATPGFDVGPKGCNSGLHAPTASTLPTEPFPQLYI